MIRTNTLIQAAIEIATEGVSEEATEEVIGVATKEAAQGDKITIDI